MRLAKRPLAEIFAEGGIGELQELPGIGDSLASKIADMIQRGHSPALERLRRRQEKRDLLTSLPTIGPQLARRIRGTLGVDSLEEVFRAAQDGRLRRIDGLGRKRVQAIRDSLAQRLQRPPRLRQTTPADGPAVAELLDIHREYRARADRGALITVAPRRFNPTGTAWLSVLRTQRANRRYCAHYANTARSHELGRQHDWVVIYRDHKHEFGQWTVVTATHGRLRGKRVVRGREKECHEHYAQTKSRQLPLSSAGEPLA